MRDKTTKTGIDVIGDTPWGTHLCLFYQTKEDLIDILVPYFKAGLENNEFCMWVTSEPLSAKDAKRSLQKAVRNLDAYIEKGQIEILDYSQWYTKSGKWEADRVLQGWIEKENQAVKRGFDGLRLTGNTSWLEERDWAAFTKYEATVDQVICNYRMLAICTYSLDRCGAAEVMDVASNHQFALVKREGKWKAIESAKRKRAEEALRESEQRYRDLVEDMAEGLAVGNADGILTYVNSRIVETLEYSPEEMLGKSAIAFVAQESMDLVKEEAKRQRKGIGGRFELVLTSKTGKKVPVMVSGKPLFKDGKYIGSVGIFVDITERKRVEEALRQSEKRLRTVIEASLDGIIAVNDEGRIVVFNGAAAELFQYSEKEALNQPVKILLREEAGEIHQERLEQFLNKGIGQCGHIGRRMQKTFRRKDGSFFPGEASMAGGRFDGLRLVVLSVHDISDREKAEKAVQESEERYRSLVEAAPDVIYTISAEDGSLTSLNPAFETLTGWSRAEWLGKPFMEIVHPDDRSAAVETFQKALRGEAPPLYQLRVLSKSGEYLVGEFTSTPLMKGGKVVGELGIARDITERKLAEKASKRAEEALRESEQRLRILLEQLPIGVSLLDQNRNMIYANPALEKILDISRDDLLQGKYEDRRYIRPDGTPMPPQEYASARAFQEQHPVRDVEIGVMTESGKTIWTSVSAALFPVADKGVVIATVDITERKLAEEASKRAEEQLKSSREQMRALAAHLHKVREEEKEHLAREFHDQLGQTLTALTMDLTMLQRQVADKGKGLSRTAISVDIQAMQQLADHAVGSIREIMAELRPELLDQLGILPALEFEAESFQRKSGISCVFTSLIDEIQLDQEKSIALFRIFQEALTNVARHAKATSVRANIRMEGKNLLLEIKDNGVGISPGAEDAKDSFGIIGMRERALVFGGAFEIRVAKGEGTTIVLRLPLEETLADGGSAL